MEKNAFFPGGHGPMGKYRVDGYGQIGDLVCRKISIQLPITVYRNWENKWGERQKSKSFNLTKPMFVRPLNLGNIRKECLVTK